MTTLRVVIPGALGRIGQALIRYIHTHEGVELYGATERPDHPDIAKDIGGLVLGRNIDIKLENDLRNAIIAANAIIDFTRPEASVWHAEIAAHYKIPIVIGTTGCSKGQLEKLRSFSDETPMVLAPNMSVGVNLLFYLAQRVAATLGEDYDVEIVEKHHRKKVDAPSGTALRLAVAVARAWGRENPEEIFDHGRHGHAHDERDYGRIGLHAVRGGDIVGDHDMHFIGDGEMITLSHRATTRENFVKGAIKAAFWLQNRDPGQYDMADVLGLK